jgi:PKD repeat protein
VNKCNSFATVPYTITNNGQAQLSYSVDVAEIYDSSYTQAWLYPAPNYSNTLVYNFNNIIDSDTIFYEIVLNGEYSQTNNYFYLYANGSYMQTVYDNNVSNYTNDTISGFITGWQLTNIMNAGYLTIQLYSYNYNSVSGQTCQVQVWQRDDVTWASPVGVATGTLAAGNTVSKSILVTVSNLALGTYYSSVVFETNDPQDPVYQVPMTVHVVSEPDMVLGANAINYGNVYNTTPVKDSVLVTNDGCTDLSITNVVANNAHFVPSWTSKVIAAGASAWLDVTFTATTATQQTGILTITNNDSIQYVNLAANVIFAPDADYQYQVQNACNGEVSFINESTNGSQYFWAFGDGTFSAAVNPTHNYSKPGTYQVMLVTSNAGGSDTLYKNVALNDILYVASEFPDTVQAGTTVQFIDSSMYANSWQWYFGDGGNATSPNPQHTYANKGTFIVTLLVTNSAGCSGSDNDAIIVTSGIGIDQNLAIDLTLYPNPTQGLIEVQTSAEVLRMELYSPAGQLVFEAPFRTKIDLSAYPAGTYQLVFRGEDFVVRKSVGILH